MSEIKRDALYRNDAVWAAFYRDGKNLGEIAKEFDCGIYDLAPWLTAVLVDAILSAKTPSAKGTEA